MSAQEEHTRVAQARFAAAVVQYGDWRHAARQTQTPLSTAREWLAHLAQLFRSSTVVSAPASAPMLAGRLFGRANELERICHLFDEPGVRCVSIHGAAGVGKTRLAVEAARRVCGVSKDIAFVDAAQADSLDSLLRLVVQGLSAVAVSDSCPTADSIAVALDASQRAIVVVLDGVDAVESHVPALLCHWMGGTRHVEFLLTSRCRLSVNGGTALWVPPLVSPQTRLSHPAQLLHSPAAAMFVERMREAGASPDVESEAATIGRLIRAMDGLPAQLERAAEIAARDGITALADIAEHPLRCLDAGQEQQSLRIDYALSQSWKRLSDNERTVASQCSVFRGGFDVASCAYVCGTTSANARRIMDRLIDTGLALSANSTGPTHVRLLHAARELAEQHLPDTEVQTELLARHASYYATRARHWCDNTVRLDAALRTEITQSLDNLSIACVRAAAGRVPVSDCIPMVCALLPRPTPCAPLDTVARMIETLLQCLEQLPSSAQATIYVAHANVLRAQGHIHASASAAGRARVLVAGPLPSKTRAATLTVLSNCLLEQGKCIQARQLGHQALVEARTINDPHAAAHALVCLAEIDSSDGRWSAAREFLEAAAGIAVDANNPGLEAQVHNNLGSVAWLAGDQQQAEQQWRKSLALYEQMGDEFGTAQSSYNLAINDIALGHANRALIAAKQVALVAHHFDSPPLESVAATIRAISSQLASGSDESEHHMAHAVSVLDDTDLSRHKAFVLAQRSALRASHDHTQLAQQDLRLASTISPTTSRSSGQLAAQLEIASAHIALAESRQHASELDAPAADAARQRAMQAFARIQQSTFLPMLAHELRNLTHAMENNRGPHALAKLQVDRGGAWFRRPHTDRIDLTRRPMLRRVLECLVTQHTEQPRVAISPRQLIDVVWPHDSELAEDTLRNRLYVAVASLRKLGMKDVLVKTPDGYMLDPDTPMDFGRSES